MLHARINGSSYDFELDASKLTDDGVREELASLLSVHSSSLTQYVIDRRPGGAVVVRPEAVYG